MRARECSGRAGTSLQAHRARGRGRGRLREGAGFSAQGAEPGGETVERHCNSARDPSAKRAGEIDPPWRESEVAKLARASWRWTLSLCYTLRGSPSPPGSAALGQKSADLAGWESTTESPLRINLGWGCPWRIIKRRRLERWGFKYSGSLVTMKS